jgi:MFS family permease
MPAGFHRLIAAQFFSALADNALLIVTMALLQQRGLPGWWAPLLKFGFTLSYVFLAPLVGPLADAMPKARLMAWMNAVKIAGVIALALGANPIAAFVVVGFGAAAYAPAKYGLVTELVEPRRLVAANGWLEVSVVCAVLLGTVFGGVLVSPWIDTLRGAGITALHLLLAVYALSSWLNVGIPDSGARYARRSIHPVAMVRDFFAGNATLWRDALGGLSLAATTLFWGADATLQFVVLRWAQEHLGLPLHQASWLQAAVAVGVVIGAALAGRFVALQDARRMLGFGVAFGLMLPAVAGARELAVVVPVLVVTGALGGLMVVPLNALLQHRGCVLLTAGRSIAVQGFNENASILVMLAVYAALAATDLGIVTLLRAFGLLLTLAIGALMWRSRRVAG